MPGRGAIRARARRVRGGGCGARPCPSFGRRARTRLSQRQGRLGKAPQRRRIGRPRRGARPCFSGSRDFGLATPGGMASPQAPREGASRIQIHNLSPPRRGRPSLPKPSFRVRGQHRSISPGAKLAAEMLVRKASLVTHARRLARAMTGAGAAASRRGGFGADRAGAVDVRRRAPRRAGAGRGAAVPGGRRRRGGRAAGEETRRQSRRAAQGRPAPGERGPAEAFRQPHLSASRAHAAFRAAPATGAGGERGRARAECAAARGRARGFRRARRDHECEARTRRHPLRARAGARHEILARHQPRRRCGALDERGLGAHRRRLRAQRHRHRIAEPEARDRLSARAPRLFRFRELEIPAAALPRQDDRRRAGDRRARADAASPDRRHHGLGQIGRDQHHDPVAALPPEARGMPPDHGRSEDARTFRL